MELKDVQGCFFSNHHVQLCTFLIYSHCILVHFFPRPLFSITIILNVHFIKFKFYKKKKKDHTGGGGGGAGARHNCTRIKTCAEI